MCAGPGSLFPARRALGGSLWECGWPGLPGAGQAGCGREERSETVGGPRALPLLPRARARGLPSERSCAQFGRLQGHARVSMRQCGFHCTLTASREWSAARGFGSGTLC